MPSSDPPAVIEPPKTDFTESTESTETTQPQSSIKGAAVKLAPPKEPAVSTETEDLTPAEKKKRAKAEKAARRAQTIKEKQVAPAQALAVARPPVNPEGQKTIKGQQQKRRTSTTGDAQNLPLRTAARPMAAPVAEPPKEEDKTVEFFRHLNRDRRTSIAGAGTAIHPAVLALGLQMSSYTICGSSARLVATLQAFKRVSFLESWIAFSISQCSQKSMEILNVNSLQVIESYTTPTGNSLTRHLTPHVLSPNVDYLSSCRPLSISMGNAIRWLKLKISKVDPDTADAEAKRTLCDDIDVFVRERVTYADQVIAERAAERINDGDVIMTYAKSSVVQNALVKASEGGKKFKVIVVDSRPLHEGKHLAAALIQLGIEVKYCLLNGLAHNIQDTTKVMLGAHAMMSNGRLFSRVGTALVAMEANDADKPVLVLCETIKFTQRVALDSIVHNEIAPPDELLIPGGPLENWRDMKRLQLCNPMFDVTPAEFIQMIVTESGNVPPTSVPVLHRLGNEPNEGQ
jgi:translation initiation factor eIF-2B subunit delta